MLTVGTSLCRGLGKVLTAETPHPQARSNGSVGQPVGSPQSQEALGFMLPQSVSCIMHKQPWRWGPKLRTIPTPEVGFLLGGLQRFPHSCSFPFFGSPIGVSIGVIEGPHHRTSQSLVVRALLWEVEEMGQNSSG